MNLTPSLSRARQSLMEFIIEFPAHSTTTISYEFDRVFLKLAEHPPDANRGFNIGPTVLEFVETEDKSAKNNKNTLSCLTKRIFYSEEDIVSYFISFVLI
ncbi:GPI transamidase component PIG-T [Smittium culicis]|uniref:GPI transamidase component PIG-T n=2 Tax=Smittium culicis TaxID=133412 RepID=A0A1R1XN13_9FUNG|nr:GPI transamidase component PIG-T [Smittium culicis]